MRRLARQVFVTGSGLSYSHFRPEKLNYRTWSLGTISSMTTHRDFPVQTFCVKWRWPCIHAKYDNDKITDPPRQTRKWPVCCHFQAGCKFGVAVDDSIDAEECVYVACHCCYGGVTGFTWVFSAELCGEEHRMSMQSCSRTVRAHST